MLMMSNEKKTAASTLPVPAKKNEIVKISKHADLFEEAKNADGEEITTKYLNFEETLAEGESVFLVAKNMTEIADTFGKHDGAMCPAVLFENEAGENVINADAVIVSTISREFAKDAKPFLVEIIYKGKEKGKNGTYRDFSIIRKSK